MRAILLLVPALLCAQTPAVGIIDVFGLKKIPRERILKALAVREGGPLPASKGDVEARLTSVSGVAGARLEAVCCEEGKAVLYVGIEEKGSPHFEYRYDPDQELTVPDEVAGAYRLAESLASDAMRQGVTEEDLTAGHALLADDAARRAQLQFVDLAEKHLDALRTIVKSAADPEQRAIAATILPYYRRKFEIVNDLLFAVKDADPSVRAAAIKGLRGLQVRARMDPDSEIRIAATWFIEMLNSLLWSDRDQAARMLVELSETREERVLIQIRERAMPALIEMASVRRLDHSLPPYLLLGRVLGLSDTELQETWARGEREAVVQLARQFLKKKK